jgi:hypothetical protein
LAWHTRNSSRWRPPFFCDNFWCERDIFAERLPGLTAYDRETDRLQEALSLIGFAL